MPSSLIVEVCEIRAIKSHKNADNLEIAVVKEWECIVRKGQYKIGDTVIYVPIDSVLPDSFINKFNIRNYLKGHSQNRVGCAKIRGIMSYGLIINNDENFPLGTDLSEHYGIKKYYPPVKTFMGDCARDDIYFPKLSDIENIKNFPNTFSEGQMVVVTEKIDGTQSRIGVSRVDFEVEDERALGAEIYKIGEFEGDDIYAIWKSGSNGMMRKRPLVDENTMKKTSIGFLLLSLEYTILLNILFLIWELKVFSYLGKLLAPASLVEKKVFTME